MRRTDNKQRRKPRPSSPRWAGHTTDSNWGSTNRGAGFQPAVSRVS